MTTPSYGQLAFSDISSELARSATAQLSLDDARLRFVSNTSQGASLGITTLYGKTYTTPQIAYVFSASNYYYGATIDVTANDEVLVYYTTPTSGVALTKLDKYGRVSWSKELKITNIANANTGAGYVSYDPTSGIVWTAIDTSSGGGSGGSGFLTTFVNSNLSTGAVTSVIPHSSNDSYGTRGAWKPIFDASSNRTVVAGYADVQIARHNSSGTLQWWKQWSSYSTSPTFSVPTSTGGTVIGVYGTWVQAKGNVYNGYIKYDSSGNLGSQIMIGDATSSSQFMLSCVLNIDSSDNVYLAFNNNSTGLPSNSDCIIKKFNTSDTIVWTYKIGQVGMSPIKLEKDSSGNFYLVCKPPSNAIYIVKFDSSGTVLWERQLANNVNNFISLNDVKVSGSSLYLSIGLIYGGNNCLAVVKLPTDGRLTGTFGSRQTLSYTSVSYGFTSISALPYSSFSGTAASLGAQTVSVSTTVGNASYDGQVDLLP
jgi:hypothetical protein